MRRFGGATAAQGEALTAIERTLLALLDRSFTNGWRSAVGGICKTVDSGHPGARGRYHAVVEPAGNHPGLRWQLGAWPRMLRRSGRAWRS